MRVCVHVWVGVTVLGGCLRDTSHPCETAGACAAPVDAADLTDDAGFELDAPLDAADAMVVDDDPWGDGHHGHVTIGGSASQINSYGVVRQDALLGATLIVAQRQSGSTIGSWPDAFEAGDRIMLWRTTGLANPPVSGSTTPVALDGDVGRWFVTRVVARNADRLTLADPLPFACPADLTQVIKLPELGVVTVRAGAAVSARDWQGQYGGIVAFYADALTIDGGAVEATTDGFNGGIAENFGSFSNCVALDGRSPSGGGAAKGESFVLDRFGTNADPRAGRGNIYHGGGGGNCRNAGGGGGGHAGGGGAGGNDELDRAVGGMAGVALRYSPATHLASGGAGGAGEDNDSSTGEGGWAGGVVWLTVRSITCTNGGAIASAGGDGGDATDDGAGGGGGGGLIWIRAETISGCALHAAGGNGGSTTLSASPVRGPGGGGGGGKIVIVANTANGLVTQVAGGAAGTTGVSAYGALPGQAGAVCGNGVLEAGETCDDGNYQRGDGCTYCSE